jgi:RNA polymerase sigma-70 factor (ECF subfamily)
LLNTVDFARNKNVMNSSSISDEFERIWLEHRDRLHRLAVRLSGCPDAADDLLQQASVNAFQGYARFRNKSDIYTWFYRITVNVTLRWRERRSNTIPFDSPEIESMISSHLDPQKQAELSELRPAVWKAMETLPEDIRTTLILQLYEGLKYREIALMLDIPIGTVKSRLNTAIHRLREELKDHAM